MSMSKTLAPGSSISEAGLAELTRLARVGFEPEERADLSRQLASILEYVEILNSIDTTGVAPMYSPGEHAAPLRPDEAASSLSRDDLFANAPEAGNGFFVVPKIV